MVPVNLHRVEGMHALAPSLRVARQGLYLLAPLLAGALVVLLTQVPTPSLVVNFDEAAPVASVDALVSWGWAWSLLI